MEKKITFVCCPKPFNSDFSMIQHNAIQSWLKLEITRTVIVLGTDAGVKEYVLDCNEEQKSDKKQIIHHPDVKLNEWKTPLVNSIFEIGRHYTPDGELLCYINSDIILLESFSKTVVAWYDQFGTSTKNVLLVGKRWDWNNPKLIDFSLDNWEQTVVDTAKSDGRMHEHSGIDYFVHTKTTYPFIYPFGIGRYFWDWWLVGNCFRRNVMVIDITETAFVIHQNSPWFQGGKVVTDRKKMYQTPEVKRNHSFDKYGKSIKDGTNWHSVVMPDGTIQFKTNDGKLRD